MTIFGIDPASVSGKGVPIAETTTLLVVGAGVAGCTAAIEAARRGLQVVLVDENPIDFQTMSNDVPLHFGGRMSGIVRNRMAMTEAIVEANPLITEAFEVGVDVRLATSCWGLYLPAPTAQWPQRRVAGLADHHRCWQIAFEQVIVATGCRDLGIAFPGWEFPGVMGARAVQRLADSYGALDVVRAVVIGSGPEALSAIAALGRAGAECAAIIECSEALAAPTDAVIAVTGDSVPIFTGHVITRAEADHDGVTAVVVVAVDDTGCHQASTERTIECDTIVLGVAPVPNIELLDASGCRIHYNSARGGHVPVLDATQRSSLPEVFVVGDAAGAWSTKSSDPSIAQSEAWAAVDSLAAMHGCEGEPRHTGGGCAPPDPMIDLDAYLRGWVMASVVEANGDALVCQCEEVTARDILEVRPPRYLAREQTTQKPSGLRAMLGNGPPNPDQVKRLTRAGMGICQGRRCREQVAVLLAIESGVALGEVPLATYRAPVRPLALSQLAEADEDPTMTSNWNPWFGIPSQWIPPWQLTADDDSGAGDA